MTVLQKASIILEVIASSENSVSLGELTKELDFPKSTIHRLANEMVDAGFLMKDEESRYSLGFRLLYWGRQTRDQDYIARVSESAMTALRDETDESVHLYVRHSGSRVCIAARESPHNLRVFNELGRELPLSHGAAGKLLLAFSPDDLIGNILDDLDKKDPEQKQRLITEIPQIRQKNYAISRGEREPGAYALAVPIRDFFGKVSYTITLSGPIFRFPEDRLDLFIKLMHTCAHDIEQYTLRPQA